ncbi:MAG TPA: helix-turn-helix transcriptional regulator [Planctomycetota bacterium]|nr:helix-turn-helix transcriptional regulator [Planctomycetota bacterium]
MTANQPGELSAPNPAPTSVSADETFRLPSTALFLGLMPVFSGLARRADLAAILSDDPKAGKDRRSHVRTYIVHSGRETQAKTSLTLFDDDPMWGEGELSLLIKRQFGPTGLKHLLGVMIAAEEASVSGGQPGAFIFDASRHLDILGYSRSNRVNGKGYHTAKHLREAREIVTLLCSLTIVQETRFGARRGATLKIRLLLDEASAEAWEETVADGEKLKERITTNEKIFLRFNPHLFSAAAEGSNELRYQYTHQLRKLSRENARTHGLTLTLGVHLPIKFRMNGCQPLQLSARAFLRMAGIAEDEYTRFEHLERLENTLRHMVEQGYISSFETSRYRYVAAPQTPLPPGTAKVPRPGEGPPRKLRAQLELKPGGNDLPREPMEEMWQVEPPQFLRDLLKKAEQATLETRSNLESFVQTSAARSTRNSQPLLPGIDSSGRPPEPGELLRKVRQSLGLQQAELAKKLNVTQAAISMAEAGKRPRMAKRLLEAARRLGATN